jgi:transcriptional regulator with XRE-family HTH domain
MNEIYEIEFGKNIRRIRKEKKLTQDQLAAQLQLNGCDITRSALAKIEVGQRHLYPDEILLLKEILNVDFNDMFYFNFK